MFRVILAIAVAVLVAAPSAAAHKPHKHAAPAPAVPPPTVIPDFVEDQPFGARPPDLPPDVDYRPARAIGRTHGNCAYPPNAREQELSGMVELTYDVGADGVIANVALKKSSGFAILDAAALTCAATIWKSEPALVNGKPIASRHHDANIKY